MLSKAAAWWRPRRVRRHQHCAGSRDAARRARTPDSALPCPNAARSDQGLVEGAQRGQGVPRACQDMVRSPDAARRVARPPRRRPAGPRAVRFRPGRCGALDGRGHPRALRPRGHANAFRERFPSRACRGAIPACSSRAASRLSPDASHSSLDGLHSAVAGTPRGRAARSAPPGPGSAHFHRHCCDRGAARRAEPHR